MADHVISKKSEYNTYLEHNTYSLQHTNNKGEILKYVVTGKEYKGTDYFLRSYIYNDSKHNMHQLYINRKSMNYKFNLIKASNDRAVEYKARNIDFYFSNNTYYSPIYGRYYTDTHYTDIKTLEMDNNKLLELNNGQDRSIKLQDKYPSNDIILQLPAYYIDGYCSKILGTPLKNDSSAYLRKMKIKDGFIKKEVFFILDINKKVLIHFDTYNKRIVISVNVITSVPNDSTVIMDIFGIKSKSKCSKSSIGCVINNYDMIFKDAACKHSLSDGKLICDKNTEQSINELRNIYPINKPISSITIINDEENFGTYYFNM